MHNYDTPKMSPQVALKKKKYPQPPTIILGLGFYSLTRGVVRFLKPGCSSGENITSSEAFQSIYP